MRRTGLNPLADLTALRHLYCLCKQVQPEFVLGYTVKPVVYGILAAWLARVPKRVALITGLGIAFTLDGQRGFKQRVTSALVPWLYKTALRRASLVFFQNPDNQRTFINKKIIAANTPQVVVNGSGVDLEHYALAPLPGKPVFLLIARLLDSKGVRVYASAAQVIRKHYPEVVFKIVGAIDVNPDAITRRELDDWQADGMIEYLGRMDDVRPAIASSQVFVLPSWYPEGVPRTILEAMSMGRPIITTDAPGCRETVVDGENGYLVPVRSVDGLVQAMEKFIRNPELANSMGARSRQIAIEKYDVHKVNAVMLKHMGLIDN